MDEMPQPDGGLLATVTRMLKTLSDVVENRIELFFVEWQEERLRVIDALLLALIFAVCALITLLMITFAIVVFFWETHRMLVLALLTLAYAGAAVAALLALRSKFRRWKSFIATLEQIKKDKACFEKQ